MDFFISYYAQQKYNDNIVSLPLSIFALFLECLQTLKKKNPKKPPKNLCIYSTAHAVDRTITYLII